MKARSVLMATALVILTASVTNAEQSGVKPVSLNDVQLVDETLMDNMGDKNMYGKHEGWGRERRERREGWGRERREGWGRERSW